MVMAQALYSFLKNREPATELHVLAPAWSTPVVERMPEVSRAIELPVDHGELGLRRRYRLGKALRREGFGRAIVLPRSFKAALVPYFARVPIRTGYRGELRFGLINDVRRSDPQEPGRTVARFVGLGLSVDEVLPPALPQPRLRVDDAARARTAERLGLRLDADAVALMPGAEYGDAKRWPSDYYADLAGRLASVGVNVWILGSGKERALGGAIASAAGNAGVRNLCGETGLGEVIDLLATAKVAVSNDSGLMHIAAAVQTYVVALYGSTSPAMTPPLTARKHVFYLALDCSPCFERDCPLGHLRCLREISVDDVLSRVITALGDPSAVYRARRPAGNLKAAE
jgi:heptosyltransferase-2